mmetsp:Transcript_10794/g.32463  ORF Transcript_10794/g.32463 Transcript_10794/m.32463 type:complete len:262 (+) Transcript_10794:59-844(+)
MVLKAWTLPTLAVLTSAYDTTVVVQHVFEVSGLLRAVDVPDLAGEAPLHDFPLTERFEAVFDAGKTQYTYFDAMTHDSKIEVKFDRSALDCVKKVVCASETMAWTLYQNDEVSQLSASDIVLATNSISVFKWVYGPRVTVSQTILAPGFPSFKSIYDIRPSTPGISYYEHMNEHSGVRELFKFSGPGEYGYSLDCVRDLCNTDDYSFYWKLLIRNEESNYGMSNFLINNGASNIFTWIYTPGSSGGGDDATEGQEGENGEL